jgi:hypothetical protein
MGLMDQWDKAATEGGPEAGELPGDTASAPGGVTDTPGLDPLLIDGSLAVDTGRRGNHTLLILAALIAIGGGTLWAMRVTGAVAVNDASIASVESKIEQALKRLTNPASSGSGANPAGSALFKDAEVIVAMFANDPTRGQVPVDQLAKDPFELFVETRSAAAAPVVKSAVAEDKARAERAKGLKEEAGKLKLQSLLNGASSLAVINGRVVREGEELGSFKVVSISPSGVRLMAEGIPVTLTMDPAGAPAAKP